MQQIVAINEGKAPQLKARETAPCGPAPSEIRVRVKAVSVNPVDAKLFVSLPPGSEKVLGYDAAGIVDAVGEGVDAFKPGDAVFYAGDVTRPGSFSQYQCVDARLAAHKPKKLDFQAAAALPLVSLTAVESLFEHLQLPFASQPEVTLLVINGAGGVGSIAIQLAKLAGVRVIATASRAESRAWCIKMGADEVIDHQDVAQAEADWILNAAPTMDDYIQPMAQAIKPFGRVCALASAKAPMEMNLFKDKSVGFEWTFMFTRAKYNVQPEKQGRWLTSIARWVDQGCVHPIHTRQWGMLDVPILEQAMREVAEGKMVGKGVLTVEH